MKRQPLEQAYFAEDNLAEDNFAEDKRAHRADVFVVDSASHVRAWEATWPERAAVLWRTLARAYSLARGAALGSEVASTEPLP
jgi:hypothetical protein